MAEIHENPPDHEADLIKNAESLMRVIPDEARIEIMREYCVDCGSDECWFQHVEKPIESRHDD